MFCYEISDEETIRPKYNNSDGYTLNKLTDIFLIPHNSPPFGNFLTLSILVACSRLIRVLVLAIGSILVLEHSTSRLRLLRE